MTSKISFRQVVGIIQDDLEHHAGEWTHPGFQALAVHRFGNWRMQFQHSAVRRPLSAVYKAAFVFIRNIYGIEIPYTAKVGRRVIIEQQGGIVVHGGCSIGDGVTLRQGVTLGNSRLERPFDAPTIGANVSIGAGAVVIGAVKVGDGAVIGANSVVTRDVHAGAVLAGVPAVELRPASSPFIHHLPQLRSDGESRHSASA